MPVLTTYPGVYIEEISSGVHTITGVATSITAFVGYTQRGLDHRATQIFSFADFERVFGGPGRKTLPLIQLLERRRLKELASRMKIRAILRKTPTRNWTWFEQGILGLIHGCVSDFDHYQSIYSVEHSRDHTVYDVIRFIEEYGFEDLERDRSDLLKAVDRQIAGIDKSWEFVCAGYANLQSTTISNLSVPKSYVYNRSGDSSPTA
jgi:hypothetical protein